MDKQGPTWGCQSQSSRGVCDKKSKNHLCAFVAWWWTPENKNVMCCALVHKLVFKNSRQRAVSCEIWFDIVAAQDKGLSWVSHQRFCETALWGSLSDPVVLRWIFDQGILLLHLHWSSQEYSGSEIVMWSHVWHDPTLMAHLSQTRCAPVMGISGSSQV